MALAQKFSEEPERFTGWVAYPKAPAYAQALGMMIVSMSRDADNHAVIEAGWARAMMLNEQILSDLRVELERWARENGIRSLSAVSARFGNGMEKLLGLLGFRLTAQVYTRRIGAEGGDL